MKRYILAARSYGWAIRDKDEFDCDNCQKCGADLRVKESK